MNYRHIHVLREFSVTQWLLKPKRTPWPVIEMFEEDGFLEKDYGKGGGVALFRLTHRGFAVIDAFNRSTPA